MNVLRIGMTMGRLFERYADWVAGTDGQVEIVPLGHTLNNVSEVDGCHGVVFTGGEDVHPTHYGHPEYIEHCVPVDFDLRRDDFELALMQRAQAKRTPLLGICRGLQLANVYFGGTLVPDIPTWGGYNHARLPSGGERDHTIQVDPNSLLFEITRSKAGLVNSLHHQSAHRIGKGLVASARAADGIVEALEYKEMEGNPFLLLVQWHPERMVGADAPFVDGIRQWFINEVKNVS